jgi:hypothetical protein
MRVFRFSGWALIASALIALLSLLEYELSLGMSNSIPMILLGLIGSLLFVSGLPGIQAAQPQTGRLGMLGLALMGLGALLAVITTALLRLGGAAVGDLLPALSALFGFFGSLLVGWLTIRARVFHAWIGWLLIIGAVLNLLLSILLPVQDFVIFLGQFAQLAQAIAIAGYGVSLTQTETPLPMRP